MKQKSLRRDGGTKRERESVRERERERADQDTDIHSIKRGSLLDTIEGLG